MFNANAYVALDITSSDVRAISFVNNKIMKWGSMPVAEGMVKDGVIADPEAVGAVINSLLQAHEMPRNQVICTLTGLPFLYRHIAMPVGMGDVPDEAIQRAAKKEMSLVGEEMCLLWQATGEKTSEEINYFVLGIPKSSFTPLLDTLKAAKIKPFVIDVKPLAVARAASVGNGCIISLEKNYFDIVLVSNGLVRVIHSISPSINADDPSLLIEELADGFSKAVKSFNRDFPLDAFTADEPILLSGELALNPDVPQIIQESTGHPTSTLKPLIDVPPEMRLAQYTPGIGLILKKYRKGVNLDQYHDININILDGIYKPRSARISLGYAGAGTAVIVLAALAVTAFTLKMNTESRVEALRLEAAQAAQRINNLQSLNKQIQDDVQAGNTRVQDLQSELALLNGDNAQVEARKVDFASHYTSINGALPTTTDYEQIKMDSRSYTISGTSANIHDIFTFAKNLEAAEHFGIARVSSIEPIGSPDSTDVSFTIEILR